jgi:hypothetical protein
MIVHFRRHLTQEMERRLFQLPDLGYGGPLKPEEKQIKVAMTTFAFDNYELICLLKQRGCAIT